MDAHGLVDLVRRCLQRYVSLSYAIPHVARDFQY